MTSTRAAPDRRARDQRDGQAREWWERMAEQSGDLYRRFTARKRLLLAGHEVTL